MYRPSQHNNGRLLLYNIAIMIFQVEFRFQLEARTKYVIVSRQEINIRD